MTRALRACLAVLAATLAWPIVASGCGSSKAPAAGGAATTTTTTTEATTTMGTGGGDGGCVACFATPDCPPTTDCARPSCDNGCCGTVDLPAEHGCNSGGGNFCDGKGHCVACVSVGDCPPSATVCASVACTGNACVTTNAAAGAACAEDGGHACDGKGHCVDCAAASDCPATGTACASPTCSAANLCGVTQAAKGAACTDHGGAACDGSGRCVASTCLDGSKSGDETDVDCGGSCSPCATGKGCLAGADCLGGVCGTGGSPVCLAPTCSDGVENGAETDVDCGGSCPSCADTKHCTVSADCIGGHCFGYHPGTCVSCADGVKDGNETDVDCGGADCDVLGKRCANGKACALPADCTFGYCGAGACALKPDGQECGVNAECANGHCLLDTCCHVACPTAAPSSCGNDGLCTDDGTSCQLYGAGTSCGTPSCSGGMLTQGACDGAGTCGAGTPAPCPGHFACQSASVCGTSCQSDGDCAPGHHCTNPPGTCQ